MVNKSVKQLVAIVVMVLLAISAIGVSSAVKGSCLVDIPAVAANASHCVTGSLADEAAEHSEVSCSPFAPAAAASISGSIATNSPSWLIFQPYSQLLPERLDKPPRLSLHL